MLGGEMKYPPDVESAFIHLDRDVTIICKLIACQMSPNQPTEI